MLLIGISVVSFVLSYACVGRYCSWAEKRRILDYPNERSSHTSPTPRGGGIVIVAITLIGVWALFPIYGSRNTWQSLSFFTLGCLIIAGASWLDDLRTLPNRLKFGAHCAGALLAMAGFGFWHTLTVPFIGSVHLGWAGSLVTFIWIVGVTNAYNFMDGIDGIAAGQAVVAGLGWGTAGWFSGQPLAGCLGLLTAGASLGFLLHNWPPARVFMGDVGSAFLGYGFAVLPVMFGAFSSEGDSGAGLVLGTLLIWPFLFDTAFTLVRRLSRGENIVTAHRSHIYQRLTGAGYSHRVVTIIYIALAAAGFLAGRVWSPGFAAGNPAGVFTVSALGLALWVMTLMTESSHPTPETTTRVPFLRYRKFVIALFQAALLSTTYYCSFLLRLDFSVANPHRKAFLLTLPIVLLVKLPVFYRFRLFSGWWRYVGMSDLLDIVKATAVSAPIICAGVYVFHGFLNYPRSVFVIDPILTIFVVGGTRFAIRAYYESARLHLAQVNTLVIGAGRAGNAVVRELKESEELEYNPVGLVDDDPTKKGLRIQGVPVLGTTEELPRLIVEYDVAHILIAIPSATGKQMQRIIDRCRESHVDFRTLPGLSDIISRAVSVSSLRRVRVEDLLARQPVRLDLSRIRAKLEGKRIIITGAGGSIGSELARQVAQFNPAGLVLFDRSESDLFKIDLELSSGTGSRNCIPVVGDILDVDRLREIFQKHNPEAVFHAAAFKHVPMMEANCFQAVTNNIFGTYNVALIARQNGVEDFVMISSDKAVNPGNIMGVTKRVAELIILGLQRDAARFVSVRFGNVLGSKGSVLPIFEQQIADRKPITITHPEAKRYFMTIPEAVQLVLQASTMGKGGEIFVLDMGEPIKVVDLANALIKLSGLEPGRDIPIIYTGLRPGEKLFEELRLDGEGLKTTPHEKIRVLDGGEVNFEQVKKWLGDLTLIVDKKNVHALVTKLQEIVPEYTPSKEILELCEVDRFDLLGSYVRARAELGQDQALHEEAEAAKPGGPDTSAAPV